jgi:type II secretion system protein H
MPISATGNRRATHPPGFTLVELMVVLVILGLASTAVVMAIPDPGGRVRDEGERLAARALAVRDDAILQGRSTRLIVETTGYRAERRAQGRWLPYSGKGFADTGFPAGVRATTGEAGRVIVDFDATGAVAEPAVIDLSQDAARVRIDIPANGAVRVAP